MDTFWTPAGNTINSQKDLKAEINSLRQSINSLKLKASGNNRNKQDPQKSSKPKKEKFCFDCGEKNQVKRHEGCEHKGEKIFVLERFKKKSKGSDASTSASSSNTNTASTTDDKFPDNDEKTENGKQYVLCRKCFNKFKKSYGRWYAVDAPYAHKTAAHRSKNSGQNLAQVNPHAVVTQVVASPSAPTASPDPDLLKICSMTGLSMDELVNKVNGLQNGIISPDTVDTTIQQSVPDTPHQRENHLELAFGLLDDHTDAPDPLELQNDSDEYDIASHWFEDCNSFREPVQICGLCNGQHPNTECPLLRTAPTHDVSVLVETVPEDADASLK